SKPIDIFKLDAAINRWVRDRNFEKNQKAAPAPLEAAVPAAVAAPAAPQNDETAFLLDEENSIEGMDIRRSLAALGGDYETWIKVTGSFADTTPALLDILRNVNSENLAAYCITVHGLKSVCGSFGAYAAAEKAKELEARSKAGDLDYVMKENGNFIAGIEKLLDNLAALLEKINARQEKPQAEKPDGKILEKILEAADNYDIRNLEQGIAELEKYNYTEGNELAGRLRRYCDSSDFKAVTEELAKIKK
ncbi:MAG: hypothetical protein FWF22_05975, partial [Treponema sp.]|nr:hypothetical protein [Treponema sp.]